MPRRRSLHWRLLRRRRLCSLSDIVRGEMSSALPQVPPTPARVRPVRGRRRQSLLGTLAASALHIEPPVANEAVLGADFQRYMLNSDCSKLQNLGNGVKIRGKHCLNTSPVPGRRRCRWGRGRCAWRVRHCACCLLRRWRCRCERTGNRPRGPRSTLHATGSVGRIEEVRRFFSIQSSVLK